MDQLPKLVICILVFPRFLDGQRALFLRRFNKNLGAPPIKVVKVNTPDECLALCMSHDNCKAFNLNHKTLMCELLAVDRCGTSLILMAENETSYFDLVADGRCPPRK